METEANTINKAKSPMSSMALETTKPPMPKTGSGIRGTNQARVEYTATMEGMPKIRAVLRFTMPSRYLGKVPTKLIAPTG